MIYSGKFLYSNEAKILKIVKKIHYMVFQKRFKRIKFAEQSFPNKFTRHVAY